MSAIWPLCKRDKSDAIDPLAEVAGFKGERPKPSYRSVTPFR